MKSKPDISFVVVNFNGIDDTRELLKSMKVHLKRCSYEVIVVDNGSLPNQAEILANEFEDLILIRSEKNLGFSGANNLGIVASSAEHIMLINNDTLLVDDSIPELAEFLDRNPLVGAVSPKIYFNNPEKTIQYAGFTELSSISLRNRAIGYNESDNGQYDQPRKTFSSHGAAMMLRREIIDKAGMMPEVYFLYYEEFDWCQKIKEKGYEIWYYPYSTIIHKYSKTIGESSFTQSYYMTRSRMLYAIRNRIGIAKFLSLAYQIFVAVPKSMILSFLKGRGDLLKAYCLGTFDLFFLKNKYD